MTLTPVDRDADGQPIRLYPDTRRGSVCACRVCAAFAAGASVHDIAAVEGLGREEVERILRKTGRHCESNLQRKQGRKL